ncbi:MAG TPA: ACT domain-containing protein [Armatimonadota bacterium]|nr:ACT domain-containing protein [Armatimonadota bacterium]HOM71899.1 ACT domain-containing protein [Armatimonadota bacterium]
MKDTQISVFLPNKSGELAKMTSHLARFNVNIRAISVSESIDYGVVRIIVNDVDRAGAALADLGRGFITTPVVVAEIPDRPGALYEVSQELADAGINIRYIYATVTPGGGVAMAVISTDDDDRADELIG